MHVCVREGRDDRNTQRERGEREVQREDSAQKLESKYHTEGEPHEHVTMQVFVLIKLSEVCGP